MSLDQLNSRTEIVVIFVYTMKTVWKIESELSQEKKNRLKNKWTLDGRRMKAHTVSESK